jgi:hypothetical protein
MAKQWLGAARNVGQRVGPYVLLELVMPGGSVLALLLWLYQRRRWPSLERAVGAVLAVLRALLAPRTPAPIALRATALRPCSPRNPCLQWYCCPSTAGLELRSEP